MNIVFWSVLPGISGVSSSLLATAGFAAGMMNKNVAIMQTQFNDNYLLPSLLNDDLNDQAFSSLGVDAVIRLAKSKMLTADRMSGTSFGFLDGRLNIYPATSTKDKSLYEQSLVENRGAIFETLNKTHDYTFIDLPAGINNLSKTMLVIADVVVLCIPQNTMIIKDFLKRFPRLNPNKIFYLVGNYDVDSSLSLTNLMLKNRKTFSKSNLGCIPHCAAFMDAMSNRHSLSFLMQNISATKGDQNLSFVQYTKDATNKLIAICDAVREEQIRR